jgi:pimeloyl-ACP methyl ester carboxylesterase
MDARSLRTQANGLLHHVLEWDGGGAAGTVVLVHGFQDAAATWDDVAVDLARAGLRVLVPDMRGFGDGARVPAGAYYYFADYVADVVGLMRALVTPGDVKPFVVGHSMGATVVSYVAGAFPERVAKLALVDGVGPMDNPYEVAPQRMRRWIEQTVLSPREAAAPMTRVEAFARLSRFNPDIDPAVLERRSGQLVRDLPGTDGGVAWKHDPLHTTVSPVPFYGEALRSFLRRITLPVLHVSGGAKGHHVPDEQERLGCFPDLTRVTIEGGHALHWTRPKELAAALLDFWKGPAAA